MTTYYFSGVDRAGFIEVLTREAAAGMVNASVATQPAMMAAYRRWPEVPLVLDSGAFQGFDDPVTYAEIVHKVGWRFQWVANLDVIGDQGGSDRNWERLRELGVSPLWVYQVEGGAGMDVMVRRAGDLGRIGVGGLVPVIKRDINEALRLIESVGRYLQFIQRQAHFFGVGSPVILVEFAGEPWFESADSQSWLCGFKARELIARGGRRVRTKDAGLELTREECAAQNVRQVHSWLAGQPMQMALL